MVGQRVKAQRLKIGLSQREVARRTNLMQYHLSQIENDQVPHMGVDTLLRLCEVLDTTPNELLDYPKGSKNRTSP